MLTQNQSPTASTNYCSNPDSVVKLKVTCPEMKRHEVKQGKGVIIQKCYNTGDAKTVEAPFSR